MDVFTIKTDQGLQVSLTGQGARIIDIRLDDNNVALNYSDQENYKNDQFYLGATIGPIANRLEGGKLNIGDKEYKLPNNEGENSLHSGSAGYHQAFWQPDKHISSSIEFSLHIDEQGNPLPGSIDLVARYHVEGKQLLIDYVARYHVEGKQLLIDYVARTDHLNYLNLTNHVYLNLNSTDQDIRNHEFTLFANSFLLADQYGIPNGESVETHCPFHYKPRLPCSHPELTGCVDHHFNIAPEFTTDKVNKLAEAYSPESKVKVSIFSNKPGFQFYTGHHLKAPFQPFHGFCFEPQFAPNAPNNKLSYAPYCSAKKPYQHSMVYLFDWPDPA